MRRVPEGNRSYLDSAHLSAAQENDASSSPDAKVAAQLGVPCESDTSRAASSVPAKGDACDSVASNKNDILERHDDRGVEPVVLRCKDLRCRF